MNNDLISREALKEDFKSRLALCNDWIETKHRLNLLIGVLFSNQII